YSPSVIFNSMRTSGYLASGLFVLFVLTCLVLVFYRIKVEKYLRIHHPISWRKICPPVAPIHFIFREVPITFDIWLVSLIIKNDRELSSDIFLVRQVALLRYFCALLYLIAVVLILILLVL